MNKVNSRILISRNKREGRYAGRLRYHDFPYKSFIVRKGNQSIYAIKMKVPSTIWALTVAINKEL